MIINEGLGPMAPERWKMSDTSADYFAYEYSGNPLSNIMVGTDPLLNPKQFVPFHQDHDLTQAERDIRYKTLAGYVRPGSEELYIRDLDDAGRIAQEGEGLQLVSDAILQSKGKNPLTDEKRTELNQFALEQLQHAYNKNSFDIAKVGTHETIHGNIFDKDIGLYPNAIKEMLRGTSALGVPQGTNRYLGKRVYEGSPHVDKSTYTGHQGYTPRFEQDELFTQWLTGKLTHGEGSHSPIKADFPYSLYRDMDRPVVGPLGQEGVERLLEEKGMPFYNQLISDSEAGYVQDSVWSQ